MTPASASASHDPRLVQLLCAWVDLAQRRAVATVVLSLITVAVLAAYASQTLSFNVDPNALFSEKLRFQKAIKEFEQYFPVLTNSLLIVVDAETPERTRAAADEMVTALRAQHAHFEKVYLPGEDRFFEEHGLLYGEVDDLVDFAEQMDLLQPVLAELARDPSLANLVDIITTGLEEERESERDAEGLVTVLDQIREGTVAVEQGRSSGLSWESVLVASAGLEPSTRTVIVADPILDMERVLGASEPIAAIRETATRLGFVGDSDVEIRITGYPALNHEEMLGLANDTALAGLLSFVGILFVLARAYRSARMVVAAAVSLLVGLVWASAFSGASVAVLNPVSITFGVLVIGLGIDFMIHLGMHFAEEAAACRDTPAALRAAVRETGTALVLCAATTGVGFLAFAPTDYRGVSDLGIAAAGGVVSILIQTLTLFPALLRLLMSDEALAGLARRSERPRIALPYLGHPAVVTGVALALTAAALPLLPQVELDTNVIWIRNPETPSVIAFEDLLDAQRTTPWYLDALVPSLAEADALADEIRALPEVDEAVTLSDLVPDEQDEKLEILWDVALVLGLPTATPRSDAPAAEQAAAVRTLRDALAAHPLASDAELSESIDALRIALERFLERWEDGDRDSFQDLAHVLLDPIPDQLDRLRANVEVEEVTRDDLPAGLVDRMLAADGQARIQVYPRDSLRDHDAMVRFVESIRPLWSNITGLPVNLVESARATWASLSEALTWAIGAITLLLLALWRRPLDALVVLLPLLLAVLLTEVSTVVLPVSFNFVNVVVLPLLLGIGVDSGIHLVHRSRTIRSPRELLDTTTARAVVFSSATTVVSFGSLAISNHRGVSSMGVLLVIGMIWTLAANLVLLPALLALRRNRGPTDTA